MFDYLIGNAANTFSVNFFDHAFTFLNQSSNVNCCLPNNTIEVATCGKGASCAGQCSALGASLCPSGICTSDPKTCQLDFDTNLAEGRKRENSNNSVATLSGSDLKYCTNNQHRCRVRDHEECCFNPNCLTWTGRKEKCKDLAYMTGKDYQIASFNFIFHIKFQARNVLSLAPCQREGGLAKRMSCPSLVPLSWMRVPKPTQVRSW